MPTERPRTQVTHTPEVAFALDVARRRWPNESPGRLIVHLIEEGARAIDSGSTAAAADHEKRVAQLAGKYTGVYGPDYLETLREGWDE